MATVKYIVRAAPIYANGAKIAECESLTFEISGGGEAVFGLEGLLTFTKGAVTTKASCKAIVPVAGMCSRFTEKLVAQVDVEIGVMLDGKLFQVTMRPMTANYSSDSKTGRVEGAFPCEGGGPKLV